MTPHLIVMFDGGTDRAPASAAVAVDVNSTPIEVRPSTTTPNGWETTEGVAEGDVVTVTISDGSQAWALDPGGRPAAADLDAPMQELIYVHRF